MALLCITLAIVALLLLLAMPIGYAFLIGGMVFYAFTPISYFTFTSFPDIGFHVVDVFSLLAIPFFMLAGEMMKEGGLTERLIIFSDSILGRIKGKMGAVAIIASMFFGAITGSSMACVAAIGSLMIPEMTKTGYSKRDAAALVTASGFLGILIPPSIPAIFLSVIGGISLGALFLATIIPGLLLGFGYLLINYFLLGKKIVYSEEKMADLAPFFSTARLKQIGTSFYRGIFALIFPFIILGGIYGGVFSPSEAAVVAVIYGMIVGLFVYRGLDLKKIYDITLAIGVMSGVILILVVFVAPLGRVFALMKLSDLIGNIVTNISSSQYVLLILLNISLLILGSFMETGSIIIITGPIFVPLAVRFGIDPVHFGAIMVLNLGIGMLTPPFAYTLFVGSKVSGIPVSQLIRPLLPFLAWCIVVLGITTYCPSVALLLPNIILQ